MKFRGDTQRQASSTSRNNNNNNSAIVRSSSCSIYNFILLILIGVTGFILTTFDMSNLSLADLQSAMKNKGEIDGSIVRHSDGDTIGSLTPTKTIKQISILGERNSGTRWTWGHLSECFNHTLKVKRELTRYKHWFQEPVYDRYPHDTLVIAQFRNPYDWLKAMQSTPHHMTEHNQYRKDSMWKKFLTKKWTMERVGTDRWPNQTKPCQQHFEWKDLISCQIYPMPKEDFVKKYGKTLYSSHQPFYEMRNDGSGKPYDNIMEMRTDKIRNFLTVKDYEGVADQWIMQYEYLVTKGTKSMIDQIAEVTGVQPKCKPYPAQQRKSRPIDKKMAEFIKQNLNWTVEAMIGYGPHHD